MTKFYYGLSGTFKSTTLQKEISNVEDPAVVWSEIKLWKELEGGILKGETKVTDLNFAILHLCSLDNVVKGNHKNLFIERGISDMIFYHLQKHNTLGEDIIKELISKEEELCKGEIEKILLIQRDENFIKTKVLNEKTRAAVFPGGVLDYLQAQEKYIEFTKQYNRITKVVEITNAQTYLEKLGLEYLN